MPGGQRRAGIPGGRGILVSQGRDRALGGGSRKMPRSPGPRRSLRYGNSSSRCYFRTEYPDMGGGELGPGAYAEFTVEPPAQLREDLKRRGLLAGGRQGRHQAGMGPLVERLT